MSSINSLLLVADNKEEIIKFRSKLMLLRDVDSVMESNVMNAFALSQKYVPDTIIMFAENNNPNLFEIIRAIRNDDILKNTPIILLLSTFDEEYILSGFDCGISDYITLPARDSEVLMRVIWALQRSETARDLTKKEQLLEDLEVLNKKTGAFKAKYINKVFSNEINSAQKFKYPLAFIAIGLPPASKNKISQDAFAGVIQSSIRNTDMLGIPEENKFYVMLPKTKLNGVFTVATRIRENLLPDIDFYTGGCELDEEMDFRQLTNMADNSLEKAITTGEKVVIADKYDSIDSRNKDGWLNKIQSTSKNYKLFKQAFNKKLKNVIEPVFYQAQQNLQSKYDDKVIVEQFTTESKCFFSIKYPFEGKEVILKITDIGFSKVAVDTFFNKMGKQSGNQDKLELSELDSKKLINVIEDISAKFDSL